MQAGGACGAESRIRGGSRATSMVYGGVTPLAMDPCTYRLFSIKIELVVVQGLKPLRLCSRTMWGKRRVMGKNFVTVTRGTLQQPPPKNPPPPLEHAPPSWSAENPKSKTVLRQKSRFSSKILVAPSRVAVQIVYERVKYVRQTHARLLFHAARPTPGSACPRPSGHP